ncbi:MAG TPA: MraY family glycosyltransferase [Anaerolineales bacterium]|nr:MraY family glycosyltransferase [Anaerolineales bacterium]
MINRLADLFPAMLLAASTALIVAPLIIRVLPSLGLVDLPGSAPHKQHLTPTPLAGGPILALSLTICYAALRLPINREVIGILVGSGLMVLWGIADDRLGLGPLRKLVGQLLATAVLVYFGVQVRILRIAWLDLLLTTLWIVGITNAFNFVDSMDGLALGLAGIAAAFFMLVTIDSAQPILAALSAVVFGATIGAYFFNAAPARMFLGDSGSQLLGFLLAAIGIAYTPASAGLPQGVTWFTPILVLGVPIFDMTLVVASRIRGRRPVYRANRDHTFHRLLAIGLDVTRSVLAMQLTAIMLGLVAFIALDANVLEANIMFGIIAMIGLALIGYVQRIDLAQAHTQTGE